MSDDRRRVLVVDDSFGDIGILMENLKSDYAVLVATNGAKALEVACKSPQPDVILMDVEMPEMGGHEACRKLKSMPETSAIEVIFVSAHDSVEEKLAGLDAGASDYLIKPVQREVLLRKVAKAIDAMDGRIRAKLETDMAFSAAMTAIAGSGELGVVLDFMKKSFGARTVDQLAQHIVDALRHFELVSAVRIESALDESTFLSCCDSISPLERELLVRMKDGGRIIESGKRAVFNFKHISLLIKNMPDDEDRRGRYRDQIALLLEGAESALRPVLIDQKIRDLLAKSIDMLQELETEEKKYKDRSKAIMNKSLADLEDAFHACAITESQEQMLMQVLLDGIRDTSDNHHEGKVLENKLKDIVNRLKSLAQPGY